MSRALAVAERLPLDAYATPDDLALAIAQRVRATSGRLPPITTILEPSAGQGPFVRAARQVWPGAHVTAVDVDPATRPLLADAGAHTVLIHDWPTLANEQSEEAVGTRLVIGNPPYRDAERHILAALEWLRHGDQLVFLLRIDFLGSRRRIDFWQETPLVWMAPIVPRPSFWGCGTTDATEFAAFCWRQGRRGGPRIARPLVWRPPRKERAA